MTLLGDSYRIGRAAVGRVSYLSVEFGLRILFDDRGDTVITEPEDLGTHVFAQAAANA